MRGVSYRGVGAAVLAVAWFILLWDTEAAPRRKDNRFWEILKPLAEDGSGDGLIRIDKAALKMIKKVVRNGATDVPVLIDVLPNASSLTCFLNNFDGVMHPELEKKYPDIISLSGICSDSITSLTVSFNDAREKTVSINIQYEGQLLFFADYREDMSDDPNVLHLRLPQLNGTEGEDWTDTVEMVPMETRSLLRSAGSEVRRLVPIADAMAWKFRLAIATTEEYANITGRAQTGASFDKNLLMTSVVNAVARLNGIFLKEMGVMFELIPNTDELFCVPGDTTCAHLYNNSSLFGQIIDHFTNNGVTEADFDIGHTFTTHGGGAAFVPSLCRVDYKYKGFTGIGSNGGIKGDTFYLIVAHEFGHQLSAYHTWRDCGDPKNPQFSPLGAVEPGAGSSIMSYAASVCNDSSKFQTFKDPWFNSASLYLMTDYIDNLSCGTKYSLAPRERPLMQTLSSCQVAKGNYVQLNGTIGNYPTDQVFVTWDRVDPGYENYTDLNVSRFAPRQPSTRSTAFFLPNMYIISFNPIQKEEIAPYDGGGDKTMKFRFVGRTSFSLTSTYSGGFNTDLAGTWGWKDLTLTYVDSKAPLRITSPSAPATWREGDFVDITWTGGGSTDVIEVLVAVNTMTKVSAPDFNKVVQDLDFRSLGTSNNTGIMRVQVPYLENSRGRPLNLMVRSGLPFCYFFDLVPGLSYQALSYRPSARPSRKPSRKPSQKPSRKPSRKPSQKPSRKPFIMPSQMPSLKPSRKPSRMPSRKPSRKPSQKPSRKPSQKPSMKPSRKPSRQPSRKPSRKPSQKPSRKPSQKPSMKPSRKPSRQPSRKPSRKPSQKPSRKPSQKPSMKPSRKPSRQPSRKPSRKPSQKPSRKPSRKPSVKPSRKPSRQPSRKPSRKPSQKPSRKPSRKPSVKPSTKPSVKPSRKPSRQPSLKPSRKPSRKPSLKPSRSSKPSRKPSRQPSLKPSRSSKPSRKPSRQPSLKPSRSSKPSRKPSQQPSLRPSQQPSLRPSQQPSLRPSRKPSVMPSTKPSVSPSTKPSLNPSMKPSLKPSVMPSTKPSVTPSTKPSLNPSMKPSLKPSVMPSTKPSVTPSTKPSLNPSMKPSLKPSVMPSTKPSVTPSTKPSLNPSTKPSVNPSMKPSVMPSTKPSVMPSTKPSVTPSTKPSVNPSMKPSVMPSTKPSVNPSTAPSVNPSTTPSVNPSTTPSVNPSTKPSTKQA